MEQWLEAPLLGLTPAPSDGEGVDASSDRDGS